MKVQAIQNQTVASTSTATGGTGSTNDFSSYLQVPSSLEEIFREASETYGVPENLLKAVAKAESEFKADATSRCGAMGIMQLMPATARSLGVTDAYDPYQNIMGGAKYLADMLNRYDGNVSYALAAYNAGYNNVDKYGGIPPFKETQNYVVKVQGFLQSEITVPNVSYTAPASTQAGTSTAAQAATPLPIQEEEKEESYFESVMNEIFSYEDYLKFLDRYLAMRSLQEEQEQEELEQQNASSQLQLAYQGIRYTPVVMQLLNPSETV